MEVVEIDNLFRQEFGKDFSSFLSNKEIKIKTLLTDSRNYFKPEDTLFFAIKTPGGNDGHKFIKDLYLQGVRNFVVQYVPESIKNYRDLNLFKVPNTIQALSALGISHRHHATEIVAITGSRGKTTLKEMIFQLMEPYKKISRSPRSYNSKIGVPLSMWQISPESDLALIEAGISKKGEMQNLADIIQPETVIFTNIGEAHDQGFDSYENKVSEKAVLATPSSVKNIIYPFDNNLLRNEIRKKGDQINYISWSFSNPEADLYLKNENNQIKYFYRNKEGKIDVTPEESYDSENIASALAFMLKEGLSEKEIEKSFKSFHKINTRLNVSEGVNGCSIILDNYTSDLSSLLPAIDFMRRRRMPSQNVTLIISDLHHEGNSATETYQEMAGIIKDAGIDKFIGVGESLMKNSSLFGDNAKFYPSTEKFLVDFSANDFNDEIILLKGSKEYEFEKIREQLEVKKHETVLEVNLDAILRNYNYFRRHVPSSTGVIAMVKASGYGAGSYEIAKTLQDAGAAYLAVAALDEGLDLRRNGIKMPIMVMNPRAANYRALFKNNLEPVIYNLSMLETLIEEASKYSSESYPVHLKLDTGMHRMGFTKDEVPILMSFLQKATNIKVASIFSHLATADCIDMDDFTLRQIKCFEELSSEIMSGLKYEVKRHILNSAGILRFPQYHFDYVRLGIGLYGANTLPADIEKPLSTVSTLRSVIICIREITPDEAVGYGRKGKIKKKSKIATIPVGYADGINRKFGNGNMKVLLNGQKVPTIGNICMDATMLDVTGVDCQEGDTVEIFGENMSVENLAETLGTIPYEILTSVSPRVKRIYYRE